MRDSQKTYLTLFIKMKKTLLLPEQNSIYYVIKLPLANPPQERRKLIGRRGEGGGGRDRNRRPKLRSLLIFWRLYIRSADAGGGHPTSKQTVYSTARTSQTNHFLFPPFLFLLLPHPHFPYIFQGKRRRRRAPFIL